MQDRLRRLVGKHDIAKFHFAANRAERNVTLGIIVFTGFRKDFAGAIESGNGFGQLRAHGDNLDDRSDQISQNHGVGDIVADGERVRNYQSSTNVHDQCADHTQNDSGRQAHHGLSGQCADDIFQQALNAAGEHLRFAIFRVIALHHANAAQRFGQPAGDIGIDAGALAKDGANGFERSHQDRAKRPQARRRRAASSPALMRATEREGDDRCEQSANKIHHAGANQVADAFNIAHDARDQRAGAVSIVKRDRQAADVLLHLDAKIGDEALRGNGEKLRQPI